MKKITLLLLTILYSIVGYSQFPENFEDPSVTVPTGFPAGWIVTDNLVGTTTSWNIVSNASLLINGTKSAYINRQEIGMGNTSEDWLISPSTVIPTNGQLRFFTRQSLPGDDGTLYQIRIYSGTSQTDLASYILLEQWTETELNANYNVPEEKVVDFPAASPGTFIAFVRVYTQPTAAQGGDRWVIDDINVVQKCLTPTSLNANNIAATQANLFWNAPVGGAAGYQIEVIEASQSATGTVTDSNVTVNYLKTGLTQNTNYKYYVRSDCGDGNFSEWVGPFNFQTLAIGTACADPIIVPSLPFQTINNTGNFGNTLAGPQLSSCIAGGTNYQSGNDVFYSYTAAEDCLVSFTLDPTETKSSMFIYPSCAGITGACLEAIGNTTSNVRVINLNVVANTTYIIVISSNSASPTIAYNLLIQCEACLDKPIAPTVSNITLTGADLAWTPPAAAVAGYEVAVQAQGVGVPTGVGQYNSATPNFQLTTQLNPATLYEYWVRSECSPGVFSAWVGPVLFNTQICAPADQCTYIFRMTDSANNGWNGARMQVRQNGIVVATIGSTYNSGAGPVDVPVTVCDGIPFDVFFSVPGSQPQQCIISVVNSFGQTIQTIAGTSATVGTSIYTGTVNCDTPQCNLAPTNVTITNIATSAATINWVAPGTEGVGYDIYLVTAGSPVPNNATLPTFSGVNGPAAPFFYTIAPNTLLADTNYDVYVRVQCADPGNSPWSGVKTFKTLPTCPKPTVQTVTGITTNSATLGWTPGAGETQWEVLLLAAPDAISPAAPGIIPDVGANDFYIQNITGTPIIVQTLTQALNPATIYYYYVRAVCQPGDDASTWTGPFIFNTITCDATEKCTYRFLLTNTTNNNWNFGRMEVRQNGIVVATLGTGGVNNPNGIPVSICNNVPFDLFWSIAGNLPEGIGVTVINSFNDIIYTKLPGAGTPLTVLFSDLTLGNCEPPTCPKPVDLLVTSVTQTSATLSWTETGSAIQWEVFAVVEGGTPPVNGTPLNTGIAGYSIANSNLGYIISNLLPGTQYQYYVRAICSETDRSTWTILNPASFITKPANDECSEAIVVPVNPTRICADSISGNTLGGTGSVETSNCPGNENDDVWYSFVATNTFHIITLSDVVGTSIRYAVYNGTDCGALNQIYCSPANPTTNILGGLVVDETYKIRVYTNGSNPTQFASFTLCITTPAPITNDECATAIPAVVNAGLDCVQVTAGSVTGATASAQSSTCAGNEDDDVWFSFVATSPTHIITFQDIVGTATDLNSSLYSGDECGNLTFISCNNNDQTLVNNLVAGTTYKIRVWSASSQLEDIQFNLCIGSIVPPITVNTTQYTNQELVTDVLIKSTCATVSNINWSTGTGANNGIGYFNKSESDFAFEDGIVLVSGSAVSVPGPNTNILSGGGLGGDADLSAILAAQTPPVTGTLNNATSLEFNFVAINPIIEFEFMFASEEYGTFQCGFSDAFAFILTDITAGTPAVNLAVIPNTNIPVTVYNIRDSQYNANCSSENEDLFGNYYANPSGVLGAPINFNGITVPMMATSPVTPGNTYRIKMVIADINDGSYDSAVFLKGDSFDIGNIELPEDYLIADGTALCLGEDVILDSQLDPTLYDIQWYNGETLIPGATGPALTVTESGTYYIHASYVGTTCVTIDSIVVEYFVDEVALDPADLVLCDASGQGVFDLTSARDEVLSVFPTDTHDVVYFLTEEDAQNNVIANALTQAQAEVFAGVDGQEIWVRVNFLTTNCFQVVSFNLVVQDLTPLFTLSGSLEICPEGTTTITVVPTDNSFDVNLVTYEWTFNTDVIPTETASSLAIAGDTGYGTYTVTVNNSGCTTTETFEIVPSTIVYEVTFEGTAMLCPEETGTLTATVTNNTENLAVTYTFTLPDASEVVSTNNVLPISEIGIYTVEVDILGCTSTQTFEVMESDVVWDITFEGTAMLCPEETGTLTATVTNNTENLAVTYTFTLPDASEVVSTNNVLPISEIGIYTVEVDILGCTTTQTFEVMASDVVWDVTFNGSATLCPDESGTLTATVNNNTQNATVTYTFTLPDASEVVSTNNVLPINDTGVYTLVISILGCESAPVTFTVAPSVADWQVAFVGEPYVICEGESTTLAFTASNFDIDDANATYAWASPAGVTGVGKTFSTNEIGTHTLSVNIFGCISTFNVEVAVNNLAIDIDFTQGCENNLYRLVAIPFNDSFDVATSTFVWTGPTVVSTDQANAIVLGSNGVYTVKVTNSQGCSATETITVNNVSCVIQKGISPNNDGDNDVFDLSALNVKELFIYNRYGTEVYNFPNYTDQWGGQSSGGKELPDGTYFYMIHTVAGENISGWIYINR
ncbi:choice-of-anchor L domain-containing protein [Flavobacterium sp. SM2513]|uniref:choice-of-anchor L domain-containing protein n=1 Tax=Flavobacterium sp. SM2513 TaxID=3424766 RepID=UPI003D7F8AA1